MEQVASASAAPGVVKRLGFYTERFVRLRRVMAVTPSGPAVGLLPVGIRHEQNLVLADENGYVVTGVTNEPSVPLLDDVLREREDRHRALQAALEVYGHQPVCRFKPAGESSVFIELELETRKKRVTSTLGTAVAALGGGFVELGSYSEEKAYNGPGQIHKWKRPSPVVEKRLLGGGRRVGFDYDAVLCGGFGLKGGDALYLVQGSDETVSAGSAVFADGIRRRTFSSVLLDLACKSGLEPSRQKAEELAKGEAEWYDEFEFLLSLIGEDDLQVDAVEFEGRFMPARAPETGNPALDELLKRYMGQFRQVNSLCLHGSRARIRKGEKELQMDAGMYGFSLASRAREVTLVAREGSLQDGPPMFG